MDVKVTTPSLVRGAGVAAAMLVPGHNGFARVLRSAFAGAGYLGSFAAEPDKRPEHYTLVSVTDVDDMPDQVREYGSMALGTASWVGITAVLGHLAAVLPLPKVLKAAALGSAVAVGDAWVADRTRAGRIAPGMS